MSRQLDALVASSNHLLNLQLKLTKTDGKQVPGMPRVSPLQMPVDDRFGGGVLTRGKKSILPPQAFNRFESEVYPITPPVVDFVIGSNTRWIGREPTVVYHN